MMPRPIPEDPGCIVQRAPNSSAWRITLWADGEVWIGTMASGGGDTPPGLAECLDAWQRYRFAWINLSHHA